MYASISTCMVCLLSLSYFFKHLHVFLFKNDIYHISFLDVVPKRLFSINCSTLIYLMCVPRYHCKSRHLFYKLFCTHTILAQLCNNIVYIPHYYFITFVFIIPCE